MIAGKYTTYGKPGFCEIVNVMTNFLGQPLSVNVTSGMAWTTKGVDCFNPNTINARIPLYKFHSSSTSTYSLD